MNPRSPGPCFSYYTDATLPASLYSVGYWKVMSRQEGVLCLSNRQLALKTESLRSWYSLSEMVSSHFMNPKGSFPCSQKPIHAIFWTRKIWRTPPSPTPFWSILILPSHQQIDIPVRPFFRIQCKNLSSIQQCYVICICHALTVQLNSTQCTLDSDLLSSVSHNCLLFLSYRH